jgi:hypothetical protein
MLTNSGRLKITSLASTGSKTKTKAKKTISMATTFKTSITDDLNRWSLKDLRRTNSLIMLADSLALVVVESLYHRPKGENAMALAREDRLGLLIPVEVCNNMS